MLGTDSARGPNGQRQVDSWLLALAALLLTVTVLAVFPLRLLPAPWWADSVLHFGSGTAITLGFAAVIPRRDDAIALAVAVIGFLWEPAEWTYFACELPVMPAECTAETLAEWMRSNDTQKDIVLVALGALVTLLGLGRYQ